MCKLLRTSLLCSLFLFTFCISCSFAANPDYTKLTLISYDGSLNDFANALCNITFNRDLDGFIDFVNNSSVSTSTKTTVTNRVTDIKNKLVLPNTYYFYFEIYQTSGNGWIQSNFAVYYGTSATSMIKYVLYLRNNNTTMGVDYDPTTVRVIPSTNSSYSCWYWNLSNFYKKTNNTIESPTSLIKFEPNSVLSTIDVIYSGGSLTALKITKPNNTLLGTFSHLEKLTSGKQLKCILGYSIDDSGNLYNWADYYCYLDYYNQLRYFKGGLTIDFDGNLRINTNNLLNNQYYVLQFLITDNDGHGINSDILDDTNNFTDYYCVPNGSTATSGDIMSPDFVPTGGNQQLIDLINQLNQNDSGNSEYIIGQFFSGDFFSGDLVGSLGLNIFDEQEEHFNFIRQIFDGLISILNDNSTNSYLQIDVHDYHKTLYASDFITPSSPLKIFVTLFLIAGTIILLYQQFTKMYFTLVSLDINNLLHVGEIDYTFFM